MEAETKELSIIQNYLPKQLSGKELQILIDGAIASIGAKSMKQMGAVMTALKPSITGKADMKVVTELVKKRMTQQP